ATRSASAATVGGDASAAAFALGDPNRAGVPTTPPTTDGGTGDRANAGSPGDALADRRRGLLIGTPDAIESVRESVSGVSDALDAALDGIAANVS
ncbi:dihydropteroate synthase, partial [Halorubrum sp. SS5]